MDKNAAVQDIGLYRNKSLINIFLKPVNNIDTAFVPIENCLGRIKV